MALRSQAPFPRPPRQLTLPARLAVLFGGVLSLVGSILFGTGMIFFWIFVMNSELVYLGSDARVWQAHTARIAIAEATGASENEEEVVRYLYEYEAGGEVHAGRGYTTGWRWDEGQSVPIEIDAEEPGVSRLPAARRALFGAAAGFAGVFPLIGAVLLAVALLGNRRHLRLMVHGELSEGKVVDRKPTSVTINDQPVYRYTIEYPDAAGRSHRITTRTHKTDQVEDEPTETLLYDPERPDRGVLLDALPLVPAPGPGGLLRLGPGGAVRTLLAPALCLLPHVIWVVWRYGIR